MAFVANDIYMIYSAAAPGNALAPGNVLDLVDGSPKNGTSIHSFTDCSDAINVFKQQWLVTEVSGQQDTYTLRNLRGGTYLDLSDGKKSNGTKIQGWKEAAPESVKNQWWKLTSMGGDKYRIQNVAGGTYIDIKGRNLDPGVTVHGWEIKDTLTQQWTFKRMSRSQDEIKALLAANRYVEEAGFESFHADVRYLTLPQSVYMDIYNGTHLKDREFLDQLFDCDDFAFVAKAEVVKWGPTYFRAADFSILFGVMFGTNDGGAHAYNWYLNKDLTNIMFFEPQTGMVHEDIGYMGYFGVF